MCCIDKEIQRSPKKARRYLATHAHVVVCVRCVDNVSCTLCCVVLCHSETLALYIYISLSVPGLVIHKVVK